MLASTSPPLMTDLADIFPAEAILIGLQHRAKAGVISELVQRLVETGRIAPEAEQSLIDTIVAREKMGSTALGNGVAFPHCRSSATESFVGAIGVAGMLPPQDAQVAQAGVSAFQDPGKL